MTICSDSLRPSGDAHVGAESRLITSRFPPSIQRFVRFSVFSQVHDMLFTMFFSDVRLIFSRNDLWSLHRLRSILSSYHPLPTTK